MEKNIYFEVSDAIKNYSDKKDYEIFNVLHEKIYVFDKYVIERKLKGKIKKVLHDFYRLSSFKVINPIFNEQSNIDFVRHFSEYLELRYNNDELFYQGFRYIDTVDYDYVKKISIKDFIPLNNRFFDSQPFYFSGFIYPSAHLDLHKGSPNENHFWLYGADGGKLNLFLSNIKRIDLLSLHHAEEKIDCINYGKVSYDPSLLVNVINSKNIYLV